jgi:hypothetical protein
VLENDTKDPSTSLGVANILYKTAAGAAITHSFVATDANGVYELTGTGFVVGDVLSGNGVLKVQNTYEILKTVR